MALEKKLGIECACIVPTGAIGHFHVGDVPGRHEPGTGEIDYGNVFKVIQGTGFRGFVAVEYSPAKNPMDTLREVRGLYAPSAPGLARRLGMAGVDAV